MSLSSHDRRLHALTELQQVVSLLFASLAIGLLIPYISCLDILLQAFLVHLASQDCIPVAPSRSCVVTWDKSCRLRVVRLLVFRRRHGVPDCVFSIGRGTRLGEMHSPLARLGFAAKPAISWLKRFVPGGQPPNADLADSGDGNP